MYVSHNTDIAGTGLGQGAGEAGGEHEVSPKHEGAVARGPSCPRTSLRGLKTGGAEKVPPGAIREGLRPGG
jgi:hypothetical protein